jgi:WD40 repeat protein
MNWPTHSDYQDAIQNPLTCFQDPDLQAGTAACDMLGLPRVMSGNFASVYELSNADRRWAIRCFVRQVSGQQGRYARLSQYLSSVSLKCLVAFDYKFQGIQVQGAWFPLVRMHWVSGQPLNLFLEEHYQEPDTLRKLAQGWREMLRDLKTHRLAHGDLQHGNVMVTPEAELRLVDYDGMYAPVFGRGKSPELGHANFQHPRRTPDFYDENLDNFAALLIHASFLAVAEDPSLWSKYYTGDNLIFSSGDFKAPLQSPLFQLLKQKPNPAVRQLAALLEKCCLWPAERVPDYGLVMAALDEGKLAEFIDKHEKAPVAEAPSANLLLEKLAASAAGAKPPGFTGTRPSPAPQPVRAPAGGVGNPSAPAPVEPALILPVAGEQQSSKSLLWAVAGVVALLVVMVLVFLSRRNQEPETVAAPAPKEAAAEPPPKTPATVETPKPEPAPAPRRLADLARAQPLGVLSGFADAVTALSFSRHSKWLATGGADKSIKIWDAQTRALLKSLPGAGDSLVSLNFLADDHVLCAVSLDNVARFYNPMGAGASRAVEDEKKNLFTIAVSPNGQILATGAPDRKAILLRNLATGAVETTFTGHSSWVRSVAFSADGRLLASICQDDSVSVWDIPAKRMLQHYDSPGNKVDAPLYSPNNEFLATGNDNRAVKLWSVATGKPWMVLVGHKGNVRCFAFSPDSSLLASGSDDQTIVLWNIGTGEIKQVLTGHAGPVVSLAFSPDGKLMASGAEDHAAMLWTLQP